MGLHYGLNEDQTLIADSAERLFANLFPSASLRTFMAERQIPDQWRSALGQSGLLGICAPTIVGGAGLGATDALSIVIAAGRRAAPWPVADSIVAAALLAVSHPSLAAEVGRASAIVAFAPAQALATAPYRSGWRLSGRFDAVSWASFARGMVIEVNLNDTLHRVLIDLDTAGVEHRPRKGIDPCCPTARVVLHDVAIGSANLIGPVDSRWDDLRVLFACAEMLGAARTSLSLAVDYMKVRKQFGQAIGRFQALKHIAADDSVYIESMRLAVEYAAWAQDTGADDAAMALHIAKQYCSDKARNVAEDAIQCHGGIGFTWDYDLHLYLRRILRLGASEGSAADHREAIAAALVEEFTAS